jgi:alanyl-tRNA synthetase
VNCDQVRASFLDFFRERGHAIVPSAPLVPDNDPSLLFTNAGMVQFKALFLGKESRAYVRAADTQRCLRISGKHNDLEEVGRDTYHHTLFEMLGNWSFGDYYKREAILWAWQLLTEVWKLPKDRMYATVHHTDDEAAELWRELTDVPPDHIRRFDKENFWEMGDTGPCGPCSEIHFDRGPGTCDKQRLADHDCDVNAGCARYIELWNLVFIQYNREADQSLTPLTSKHVDTGMGFERVCSVLQGVPSNYDIDLFQGIIQSIATIAGKTYRQQDTDDISMRVIADHTRAVALLITDQVLPSNEGRGYVLRRLLRRAARHGKLLGIDGAFLYRVMDAVVAAMRTPFPEIAAALPRIREVVQGEEDRFAQTIDRGLALLNDEIAAARGAGQTVLDGEVAFKLYDTFGFPLDLTEDILRGETFTVDHAGFDRAMSAQRDRGRGAQKFTDVSGAPELVIDAGIRSVFIGDRQARGESIILALIENGATTRGPLRAGAVVDVVTAETPFYAESGGQVGDQGWIETPSGAQVEITDTLHIAPGVIGHRGTVRQGAISVDDTVRLRVDWARREATRLNHSATHLMHGALRRQLGEHVRQAGSLVTPDRLRFDFNHHKPVTPDELRAIEDEVNAAIRANAEVACQEMPYDDAIKAGALAFFGEKYGDRVRVVRMGEFSTELCGGTHIQRTGDVGYFRVREESGVAAGVRRLEASTGAGAIGDVRQEEQVLGDLLGMLKASEVSAVGRLEKLMHQQRELEKRVQDLQRKLAGGASRDVLADAREVRGIMVLSTRADDLDDEGLRGMADQLRDRIKSGVIVLGAAREGKVTLLAAVTKDLAGKAHAGNLIKQLAPMIGGGGGGRPDFAQAGGKDASQLDAALARVYELVGA